MLNLEKKIKKNFEGIYKACGYKFWHSCGSYLIDGQNYKYDKRMLKKQILLFNLAKENKNILEVGVYMGHSMLLMLSSNPKLKIVGLDIDDRFSPYAVKYLKKKFPKANIKLHLGDSISNLKKIQNQFDLYHIDGDHKPKKIYNEIIECIRLNKKNKIKILFDDIDMMKNVEKSIFKCFKIIKFLKPKSRHRNMYIEFKLDNKSIAKFKNYYYIFLILDFPKSVALPLLKTISRALVKVILGKKISNKLGRIIQKRTSNHFLKILSEKLKNV